MDYVSNNIVIANESTPTKTGAILAYDVRFAEMKKKKEGSKQHA